MTATTFRVMVVEDDSILAMGLERWRHKAECHHWSCLRPRSSAVDAARDGRNQRVGSKNNARGRETGQRFHDAAKL